VALYRAKKITIYSFYLKVLLMFFIFSLSFVVVYHLADAAAGSRMFPARKASVLLKNKG
jgi:hypothetical protein